ncbi:gamma-glutamylcyclotransferase [Roseomonas sp. GC11]|uniref:gamma-glutamylcyclotransferase n=1 Tax=Roseomonas sp. GC11 TaxID=2950546 RepID=UPI00210E3558|nr:gamma-glutamylcyclotransferase [Roseomonas sp. GC11]MCQ4159747.1 gamma-glutamylcyclotransferase [Roseomonas sp. GC11]
MADPEKLPPAPLAGEAALAAEGPAAPDLLSRESLRSGAVDRMVRERADLPLLTEAERAASLRHTLATRPEGAAHVWLFGYGSLIWNPTILYAESRRARIEGWRRHFCLSTPVGRGSPENPGLVLALDAGGSCEGVAFRLPDEALVEELSLIWQREMLTGAYIPRWMPLLGEDGQVFGHGIAFVINTAAPQYADLPEPEVVRRLATARGELGSAAEYLFNTREGLRQLHITDPLIEHLAQAVQTAQER